MDKRRSQSYGNEWGPRSSILEHQWNGRGTCAVDDAYDHQDFPCEIHADLSFYQNRQKHVAAQYLLIDSASFPSIPWPLTFPRPALLSQMFPNTVFAELEALEFYFSNPSSEGAYISGGLIFRGFFHIFEAQI